jgi:UPF0755 protein
MKKLLIILIILLFCVAGLGVGSVLYVYEQWQRPSPLAEPVLLEVPRGYGAAQIGRILQNNGIIENAQYFRWWCNLNPGKANFKSGWYKIPVGQSIEQIAELLSSGAASLKVAIPEGKETWEIAAILSRSHLDLDSAKLDSLMHSRTFAESLGINAKDLEGYLLPNTYDFSPGSSEEAIIKILVRENLNLRDELQAKNSPVWKELGSWHNVLTMASIVEKEAAVPHERAHIASVFINRYRIKMPLGADPTVRFIFRDMTGPIYKSQLASNSSYNTRKFAGLPPGPITNPGKAAIEATLFPLQTKDLYFVAKEDGSNEHYFSRTLDEHNRYKRKATENMWR